MFPILIKVLCRYAKRPRCNVGEFVAWVKQFLGWKGTTLHCRSACTSEEQAHGSTKETHNDRCLILSQNLQNIIASRLLKQPRVRLEVRVSVTRTETCVLCFGAWSIFSSEIINRVLSNDNRARGGGGDGGGRPTIVCQSNCETASERGIPERSTKGRQKEIQQCS